MQLIFFFYVRYRLNDLYLPILHLYNYFQTASEIYRVRSDVLEGEARNENLVVD